MVCLCCLFFFSHNNYKRNIQTYSLVCRKNTDNINSKMVKTKNGRLQLKSQCSVCGNKKVDLSKNKKQKEIYHL